MSDVGFISTGDALGRVSNTQRKTGSSTLGKDDFLKILMTQLANQDPMQPMQDRDFIAQMAQFTSVEQLTNMSNELKLLRQSLGATSNLIGMQVSWIGRGEDGSSGPLTGIVDSIIVRDGTHYATVHGEQLPLDSIIRVEYPMVQQ